MAPPLPPLKDIDGSPLLGGLTCFANWPLVLPGLTGLGTAPVFPLLRNIGGLPLEKLLSFSNTSRVSGLTDLATALAIPVAWTALAIAPELPPVRDIAVSPWLPFGIGRLSEPPPTTRPAISPRFELIPGQNVGILMSEAVVPPLGLACKGNKPPTVGGCCAETALGRPCELAGTGEVVRKEANACATCGAACPDSLLREAIGDPSSPACRAIGSC